MAYKTHFELNPQDIELIEDCIGREVGSLTRHAAGGAEGTPSEVRSRVHTLRSLLGKLHNQKIWYQGEGDVARIPRG